MMVRRVLVDLSKTTIRCFFCLKYQAPRFIAESDHRLGKTWDKVLMRDLAWKSALMRWAINHIVEQVQEPFWVSTSLARKMKASSASLVSFRGCSSIVDPTNVDNNLTSNHEILVAYIMGSYDIDSARLIADHIYEAALKWSTSIPFPWLIYVMSKVPLRWTGTYCW